MPLSVPQNSSPTASTSPSAANAKETSPAFQGASRAFNASAAASSATNLIAANGAFVAPSSGVGGGRGQTQSFNEGGRLSISRQNTGQNTRSRDVSPSHVAANFAASQASNRISHSQSVRRPSPLQRKPTDLTMAASQQNGADISSSPATKSLVQLYESKQSPGLQKTQSVRYVSKPGPPIRSPKPVRPLARPVSSSGMMTKESQIPMAQSRPQNLLDGPVSSPGVTTAALVRSADPSNPMSASSQRPTNQKGDLPRVPPPRRKQHDLEDTPKEELSQNTKQTKSRTDLSTPSNPASPEVFKESKAMSSVFSSYQNPSGVILPPPSNRSTSSLSKPPPQQIARQTSKDSAQSLSTQSLSSYMSVDSLATALVASSLASSRNPSPTKSLPPQPPPPRRHHGHSLFHHSRQPPVSRTPSPQKTMRHTMRKHHSEPSSDDDSYKRTISHHIVRKHQHKHHEGDRKRYRTEVTERERKRYEGVWAANKGLLLPPTNLQTEPSTLTPSSSAASLDPTLIIPPLAPTTSADSSTTVPTAYSTDTNNHTVLNIVARDIFRRSRLPDDVLEEVWSLATSGVPSADRLGKEEFVVAMWLIDQRLRGNKLPVKVSESVWASVRRLSGIKVGKVKR